MQTWAIPGTSIASVPKPLSVINADVPRGGVQNDVGLRCLKSCDALRLFRDEGEAHAVKIRWAAVETFRRPSVVRIALDDDVTLRNPLDETEGPGGRPDWYRNRLPVPR